MAADLRDAYESTSCTTPLDGGCGKRCFTSGHQAREAHRHASYRIRVYVCDVCPGTVFHVTNNEKRRGWDE